MFHGAPKELREYRYKSEISKSAKMGVARRLSGGEKKIDKELEKHWIKCDWKIMT